MTPMNNTHSILTALDKDLNSFLSQKLTGSFFDSIVVDFLVDFSNLILKSKSIKLFPDCAALAFWFRRSHLTNIHQQLKKTTLLDNRAPIGRVIHFAPSNVDTIFIYSLFLSLLMGNQNIVRISSKHSKVTTILLQALNFLLVQDKYAKLQKYLVILSYPHSKEFSEFLCASIDLRVIWGGDNSVKEISSYKMPIYANEIKFVNKYSASLLNIDKLSKLSEEQLDIVVTDFVNDTYWYAQQACSSPRSIFWLNHMPENSGFKKKFWQLVSNKAILKFPDILALSDFIKKDVACDTMALQFKKCNIHRISHMLSLVQLDNITEHKQSLSYHCGLGFFIETDLKDISELALFSDRSIQTLSYYGFEHDFLKNEFYKNQITFDRVVPIGQALTFSRFWDGYDLLYSMSRSTTYS